MKILISAYTGLGNMVMKTPMIKALKTLYPFATIDLIAGNEYGAEYILKDTEYINQTIIVKPKDANKQKELINTLHYDYGLLPFDAAPKYITRLMRKGKINQLVRHYHPKEKIWRRWRRNTQRKTKWVPLQANRHEIDLNLDLVEAIYQKPFKRNRETFVSYTLDTKILERYDIQQPYFIIQPAAGSGVDPTKIWHYQNFVELIEQLLKHYGHQIVIVGAKIDYPDSIKPLLQLLGNDDRIINTAGRTSIDELKDLLYYADLTICHDSGVMHMADAFNKKLIALFGPSDFSRVKPLRQTSHCLFSKTKYLNAKHFFKSFGPKSLAKGESIFYPMSGITVDEVMETIRKVY